MDIMEHGESISSVSIPVQAIYPSGNNNLMKYKTNVVQVIAILQIIIAILMITSGILNFILNPICLMTSCFIGYGIWSGVLFGVSGVLGICSVKFHPHRYLVLSNMILCIISASISLLLLIFEIDEIAIYPRIRWEKKEQYYFIAIPSLLLLFTVLEAIISIVSSTFSCKALCQCCNQTNDVPNYAFYDKRTQQFIIVSGKQGIPIGDGVDTG